MVAVFADASGEAQTGTDATSTAGSEVVAAPFLTVGGEVPQPQSYSVEQLRKLPRTEAHATDRDGKEVAYAGVPLYEVLRVAGLKFEPGAMPSRTAVAAYVLVEARDGYRAVFALSEIDPTQASQVILLADQKNGQPLSAQEGPWRIVVPADKRPARWVRQVTAISVHQG